MSRKEVQGRRFLPCCLNLSMLVGVVATKIRNQLGLSRFLPHILVGIFSDPLVNSSAQFLLFNSGFLVSFPAAVQLVYFPVMVFGVQSFTATS
jgi:hypothetical protein